MSTDPLPMNAEIAGRSSVFFVVPRRVRVASTATDNLVIYTPLDVVLGSVMDVEGAYNTVHVSGRMVTVNLTETSNNNLVIVGNGVTVANSGTNNRVFNGVVPSPGGAPLSLSAGDTSDAGTLATYSRADHRHGVPVGAPASLATDGSSSTGTATTFSRSDHRHAIPATLNTNARVGVRRNSGGSTFIRRRINLIEGTNVTLSLADDSTDEEVDVTINAPGFGSPIALAAGDTTAAGTATTTARADHRHGVPVAAPVSLATDGSSATGTATTFSRSDHRHAIPATLDTNARVGVRRNSGGSTFIRRRINLIEGMNVTINVSDDATDEEVDVTISATGGGATYGSPISLAVGDTNADGTSTDVARADHRHGVPAGAPVALATDGSSATGTATTFSRSDHRHAIPSTLDTNARVGVRRNSGGSTYTRRRINLIEGTGVTISLSDDSTDEEVDVTISAAGSEITYGSPIDLAAGDTNDEGTSIDVARADHRHGVPVGAPAALATDGSSDTGTATTFSRSDHRHAIPTTLNTNARVGVRRNSGGSTYRRRRINLIEGTNVTIGLADDSASEEVDVTISAPGFGSPIDLAAGDTNDEGTSTDVARADHRHGVPVGAPASLATDGSSSTGTATTFSRSDHRHAIPATLDTNARVGVRRNSGGSTYTRRRINLIEGTGVTISLSDDSADEEVDVTISATGGGGVTYGSPIALAAGDTTADGSSTDVARADHRHGVPVGAPASLATDGSSATGTATTFSRSDHRHAIPSTLNTNARVLVRVDGVAAGTRRAINFLPSSGITVSGTDDSSNEEVDVSVSLNTSAITVAVLDVYTTPGSHTWTKPANALYVYGWVMGGGGGGGGGRIGPTTANRCGGGAGSGGRLVAFEGPATVFGNSVQVTVGAGGSGGSGGTGTSTSGQAGAGGGISSFGPMQAIGGAGGNGGGTGASAAGGSVRTGFSPYVAFTQGAATSGTNGDGTDATPSPPLVPQTGGGGAGRNSSDVPGTKGGNGGGTGMVSGNTTQLPGLGVNGVVGPTSIGGNGGNGTSPSPPWPGAGGAGGMCGDATTPGGNGGNGGRGSGGGGGGGSTNGSGKAGDGGNGGDGCVTILTILSSPSV